MNWFFTKKACGHELGESECQVIKITYLSSKGRCGKRKKMGRQRRKGRKKKISVEILAKKKNENKKGRS
jgi:hypothetical protein